MDAVAKAPGGEPGHRRLEALEILPKRPPSVNDEEDIGRAREKVGAAWDGARKGAWARLCPSRPDGRHRLDAEPGEQLFPLLKQRGHLGYRAADHVRLQAAAHPADVRQASERGQPATAEVQAVELGLIGSMGERERGDQRAQQRGLAGLGRANHADVPGGTRQVHNELIAPLLDRPVHHPDRGGKPAGRRPPLDLQAARGIGG